MTNEKDILAKARALLGSASAQPKELSDGKSTLASARAILEAKGSLDVYATFDTTGSMDSYIKVVRDNIDRVTSALLDGSSDLRLSVNGVGDHCDGENCLQMYGLSKDPNEVRGALESIALTSGGDEPEAYECLALALAKRLPEESKGRKRAVVLIGDSVPHGMLDEPCERQVDYQRAFAALKTLTDGFYFVGCAPQMYSQQRTLIDKTRKDREQFLPLGKMVDVLPELLIALARKTESAGALDKYMSLLEAQNPASAGKIRGLLQG